MLTIASVTAALVVAGAVAKREFLSDENPPGASVYEHPDWRDWRRDGRLIGDTAAALVVTVFSDLECPYCADFHARMKEIIRNLPKEVSMNFIHYPLRNHRQAWPAAVAAECAAEQGRFEDMLDVLFARQRSFGGRDTLDPRAWLPEARAAGVLDERRFEDCVRSDRGGGLVDRGRRLGDKIGITSTPSYFVGGVRHRENVSDSLFLALVGAIRD